MSVGHEIDQRATPRVDVASRVLGHVMTPQTVVVREIGPRGVLVEVAGPLHLNAIVELRLALGSDAVVMKARVVHCAIARVRSTHVTYRAGLEFVTPSEHAALAIADFVQTAQSRPDDGAPSERWPGVSDG